MNTMGQEEKDEIHRWMENMAEAEKEEEEEEDAMTDPELENALADPDTFENAMAHHELGNAMADPDTLESAMAHPGLGSAMDVEKDTEKDNEAPPEGIEDDKKGPPEGIEDDALTPISQSQAPPEGIEDDENDKGKGKVKGEGKGKTKWKGKGKAKVEDIPDDDAALMDALREWAHDSTPLVLGCSKCRFVKTGCSKCKNPNFKGKRGGTQTIKKKPAIMRRPAAMTARASSAGVSEPSAPSAGANLAFLPVD